MNFVIPSIWIFIVWNLLFVRYQVGVFQKYQEDAAAGIYYEEMLVASISDISRPLSFYLFLIPVCAGYYITILPADYLSDYIVRKVSKPIRVVLHFLSYAILFCLFYYLMASLIGLVYGVDALTTVGAIIK